MISVQTSEDSKQSKYNPIKLLPHQKRLLQQLKDERYPIYICWSMGSGKTIGSSMCLSKVPNSGKALIICDKSTVTQWKNEVEKVLFRNNSEFNKITVHIVHYEYMEQDDCPKPRDYNMTIVDESHRFRNAWKKESTRMLHWMHMIHQCKRVIFLSGTPIVHDATVERNAFDVMMKVSASNPLEGRVFFYDPRTDPKSGKKYPKLEEEDVKCCMSWAQCFVYLQNRRQDFSLKIEGEEEIRTRLSSSKNTYNTLLRSLSNNPFPDNPALSPKFQEILKRMEDHASSKQIAYSSRRDTGVKSLQSLWDSFAGRSSFQVTGDMSQEDRATNIQKFNKKPKSVLFITDAGAQGIDLKRVDVVHIMEPAENIQDERQIINRAVRYKSHTNPDSIVKVFRYLSCFPVSGAVSAPWKHVLYESGMFDKTEMKGITRPVQYALKHIIKQEEDDQTIDEKIVMVREKRELEIQAALDVLKKFDTQ